MIFLKALLAFLVLPSMAGGLAPYLLSHYDPWRSNGHWVGLVAASLGLSILLKCVWDFYYHGRGTLAHWSPPKKLVAVGLYQFTRNPMYNGVALIVIGQSVFFGSLIVLAYLLLLVSAFQLHIIKVEEPWLAKTFPEEWAEFSAQVPRWGLRIGPARNDTQ